MCLPNLISAWARVPKCPQFLEVWLRVMKDDEGDKRQWGWWEIIRAMSHDKRSQGQQGMLKDNEEDKRQWGRERQWGWLETTRWWKTIKDIERVERKEADRRWGQRETRARSDEATRGGGDKRQGWREIREMIDEGNDRQGRGETKVTSTKVDKRQVRQ